ncbi:site-specific integrase [bacterium]|nr:site-specific integrase [bacterium]
MARAKGEDRGLFERPKDSGVWWIRWTDQFGQEHREKVGKKSAAQSLYKKRKNDAREGVKLGAPLNRRQVVTVKDLLDQYLPEMVSGKSPKGVAAYEKQASLWRKKFGNTAASELRPGDISNFKEHLLETKAAGTVNRSLTFLRRLYTLAVRDLKVPSNPVGSKRVKFAKEPRERQKYFTNEEEAKLCAATDRKFGLMIVIGAQTGLRRGEQLGLRRSDVDFENRQAYLASTKAGEPQYARLNSVALAALREQLGSHTSDWVFPGVRGDAPMDGSAVTRRFQRLCEKVGISDASWHTLRHTFVSRLVMLGAPLPTVKALARHKSYEMTLKYAHLCPAHEELNLEKLAENHQPALKPAPCKKKPVQRKTLPAMEPAMVAS